MGEIIGELRTFLNSNGGELASLPLLIFFCMIFGMLFKKFRLPVITGFMVGGMLMGPTGLDFISHKTSEILQLFNHIALGLMVLTIGTHVNFHRLKNSGRRIFFCAIFDNILPFVLVYTVIHYGFKQSQMLSLILGAIAISTAPATTIALVQENKARGTLVSTLLPLVAINNVICIIIFSFSIGFIDEATRQSDIISSIWFSLQLGFVDIVKAITLGCLMGWALKKYAEKFGSHPGELLTGIFFFVMATTGISIGFEMNAMLPCLVMGIYISNTGAKHATIINTFEEVQHIILLLFFGVAGSHVHFESFSSAGWIIFAFIGARFVGKVAGSSLGAFVSRAPVRLIKFLGLATIPQAGVAIGLLVLAFEIEALQDQIELLSAIVIVAVNLNEIIGPILSKVAFIKSGEAGQDRDKLIDFLGEEFVLYDLKSTEKEEAIEELIKFLIKSHNLSMDRFEEFVKVVHDRELEQSTALGNSVAIPHGIIEDEEGIIGVLGLSRKGIDFNASDKQAVHLVILLLTPKDQATKHLKILAEMVKLVHDPYVRKQIFESESAAELYEVIHHEEHRTFNYFLDD